MPAPVGKFSFLVLRRTPRMKEKLFVFSKRRKEKLSPRIFGGTFLSLFFLCSSRSEATFNINSFLWSEAGRRIWHWCESGGAFFLCDEQKVSSSCGFACSKIDSALEIRFCELNAVFVPCSS